MARLIKANFHAWELKRPDLGFAKNEGQEWGVSHELKNGKGSFHP
tara:strand:+ start:31926 stop:32060 length:135 start_codon:yes stop_codon:yes gene_type:complete